MSSISNAHHAIRPNIEKPNIEKPNIGKHNIEKKKKEKVWNDCWNTVGGNFGSDIPFLNKKNSWNACKREFSTDQGAFFMGFGWNGKNFVKLAWNKVPSMPTMLFMMHAVEIYDERDAGQCMYIVTPNILADAIETMAEEPLSGYDPDTFVGEIQDLVLQANMQFSIDAYVSEVSLELPDMDREKIALMLKKTRSVCKAMWDGDGMWGDSE